MNKYCWFVIRDGAEQTEFAEPQATSTAVTLFGLLEDTGALNLFRHYEWTNDHVLVHSFYLDQYIPLGAGNQRWLNITGTITRHPQSTESYQIQVQQTAPQPYIDNKIAEALKTTCTVVNQDRANFDAEQYRQTERFKQLFADEQLANLNSLPYRAHNEVIFVDQSAMVLGLNCGELVLRENEQRSDVLNFMAIVDLKTLQIQQVIVKNTGYFLE